MHLARVKGRVYSGLKGRQGIITTGDFQHSRLPSPERLLLLLFLEDSGRPSISTGSCAHPSEQQCGKNDPLLYTQLPHLQQQQLELPVLFCLEIWAPHVAETSPELEILPAPLKYREYKQCCAWLHPTISLCLPDVLEVNFRNSI